MRRRIAPRNRRTGGPKARLFLEALEDRTLLSTQDGSFQDVMLTNLRADPAFTGITGQGVGIAVIDSGVYAQNPAIEPNFVHWYDAITGQDSSYTDVSQDIAAAFDPTGHGTHVAGIAAASDPNLGVAPGASIIGIRALPAPGEAVPPNRDPIANGLDWVVNHWQDFNIRVVNLSLGSDTNVNAPPPPTSAEAALIGRLQGLGITVVAASGNDYADYAAPGVSALAAAATLNVANVWATAASFPPLTSGNADSFFLAVEQQSAVDRMQAASQRSALANQVAAPGQNIYSTWNGGGGLLYNTQSGTSMSAPLVSGLVALMQQAAYAYGGRYLSPQEVVSVVRSTADSVLDYNVDNNGRVPIVNGQVDWSQLAALPETGLTLARVNAYHAVQAVHNLMSVALGQPTDLNGSIGSAINLAPLDGSTSDTFTGNIGMDGQNSVGPNDVDLYQFVLTSPGTLDITLGPVSGDPALDSYLRLFDASGTQLAAILGSALTTGVLPAGTYYVGVSSNGNTNYNPLNGTGATNGTSTGAYQMTVGMSNPDPNGAIGGAVPFAGLPAYYSGNIGTDPTPTGGTRTVGPSDVDMYEAVAPAAGALVVDTFTSQYGAQGANTYIRVFDEHGNQLAAGTNHVTVNVTAGELVYVAVSDASNRNYDPANPYNRSATGTGGLYDVSIQFENNDQNGTPATAVPEPVGGSFNGTIGTDPLPGGGTVNVGPSDVDMYLLTPDSTGDLSIIVDGQNGFIPDATLFEVSGSQVVPVASASNGAAEIDALVQAGATYYLAVTGLGNGDYSYDTPGSGSGGMMGNYTVSTSFQPMTAAAFAAQGGFIDVNPAAIPGLNLGQMTAGNIGRHGNLVVGPSDVDLYQFVAPATETVAVHTDTSAEGSSDTYLRFFDAQGRELAHNAHAGGNSTDSLVVVSVTAGQTYYIGVNGYSANAGNYNPLTGAGAAPGSQGKYQLSVSGPPASAVQTLPAFSKADFTVSWSGTPAAGGPAVASYDVYVSEDGGPFTPFLTGTARTSATFHGITGHTYAFYGVGTDQFGNRQLTPSAPTTTRVDTTPPSSYVHVLPFASPVQFLVSWTGTDDPGGSGVATYDVFVSDNGGPYQPFVTGTAQTSAAFQGVASHTYAFYSVATDNMGNRQPTPAVAQAVTRVDGTPPDSHVLPLPLGSSPSFTVRWTGADDPNGSGLASYTISVSDNGGPYIPFLTETTQTSAVFHGAPDHSYSFYSVATDQAGNRQPTPAAAQATTQVVGGIYAVGADAGGGPEVRVYDAATGQLKFDFFAFDPRFTGGVRVAVGDVNGDGFPDIICAAGPGGGPAVRVFDGRTGQALPGPLGNFFAFAPGFTGGAYVAAGDVNGDGYADIICGADRGGGRASPFSAARTARCSPVFTPSPRASPAACAWRPAT